MIECLFSSCSDADSFPQVYVLIKILSVVSEKSGGISASGTIRSDKPNDATRKPSLCLSKLFSSVLTSSQGKLSSRGGEDKAEGQLRACHPPV